MLLVIVRCRHVFGRRAVDRQSGQDGRSGVRADEPGDAADVDGLGNLFFFRSISGRVLNR